MYKQKIKTSLVKTRGFLHWIKRKLLLITVAFMLGMSNVIYEEDKMLNGNHNYTEQEQKKDKD